MLLGDRKLDVVVLLVIGLREVAAQSMGNLVAEGIQARADQVKIAFKVCHDMLHAEHAITCDPNIAIWALSERATLFWGVGRGARARLACALLKPNEWKFACVQAGYAQQVFFALASCFPLPSFTLNLPYL